MRSLYPVVLLLLAASVHLPSASAQGGPVLPPPMFGSLANNGEAVRNLPFVLEEIAIRVQTLPDGSHITSTDREKQMRDAAVRMRSELYTERDGHLVLRSVQLWDPGTRTSVLLVAANKTARVRQMPELRPPTPEQQARRAALRADAEARRAAAAASVTAAASPQGVGRAQRISRETVQLPPRSILGVRAEGRRTTHIIPVGQIGNERELSTMSEIWTSPELQIELDRTTEDYTMSKTVVTVISLDRVEANPGLFEIPPDYTVLDSAFSTFGPVH